MVYGRGSLSALPAIFSYMEMSWNGYLTMMTVNGYLIYPIIGYILATTDFSKLARCGIYLLGLAGAGLRYFMTVFLSKQDGKTNTEFFSYTGYYAILLAVAIFVLFKYLPLNKYLENNEKVCKIISNISSCSFGVYLIHMFVLRSLARLVMTDSWYWRMVFPVVIYAIAFVVVYLVKKIPVIKKIFP